MPSFSTWIQSKYNDLCQGNHQKKYKIYKYNYTCNRLPKLNLLKKSSELEFSSGELLTIKEKQLSKDFEGSLREEVMRDNKKKVANWR